MNNEKNQIKEEEKKPLTKPDSETLNTTDPQDHMEGPISSIVQSVKEKADEPEVNETSDMDDEDLDRRSKG